jgi:hypothetical protein
VVTQSGSRQWRHWSLPELGSPATPVGKSRRSFFLCSQSSVGSSPGPFLSSREHQNTTRDGDWLDLGFDGVGGTVQLSSGGYEERNGITVLRWCAPTRETGLKVSGMMRRRASLSLEVAAGKYGWGHSTSPFIGARVPVHSKQPF